MKDQRQPLTQQQREEFLAKIVEAMDNGVLPVAYILRSYAQAETDSDTFRQVFDRVSQGFPALDDMSLVLQVGLDRGASAQYGAYLDKLMDIVPTLDSLAAVHKMGEAIRCAAKYPEYSFAASDNPAFDAIAAGFRDKIEARLDAAVEKMPADARINVLWNFSGVPDLPSRPFISTPYSEKIFEKLIAAAEEMDADSHTRRWALGRALEYATRDGAVQNKARQILLEDIATATLPETIVKTVEAVTLPMSAPDREIDDAGAERWQDLTKGLSAEDRQKAAERVIGDIRNARLSRGETWQAAVKTTLAVAGAAVTDKAVPENVVKMLRLLDGHGVDGAAALLNQATPQPADKPRVSLDDFLKNKKA